MMARKSRTAGVRTRIVVTVLLVTSVSMAVLSALVAMGVRRTLVAQERDYLAERLEAAVARVEADDLAGAVDVSGPVVLQVLDARGSVLASSASALSDMPVIVVRDADDDDADADDADDADDAADDQDTDDAGDAAGNHDAVDDEDDASGDTAADDVDDDRDSDDTVEVDDDAWDADDDVWDADDDAGEIDDVETDVEEDDFDFDEDGWEDADAIVWHLKYVSRVASAITSGVSSDEVASLPTEVERVLTRSLGVASPYLTSSCTARYQDEQVTVVALASLASAAQAAASALRLLACASVAVVLGAALLTWFLVGRTLRPVEEMRATTVALAEHAPSMRIEVPEDDRDLRELAATFNDLLQRSEQALLEQRRFVSDASHQLKSPVAAQRVMIDTLREHPDALDRDEILDDLARENNRLEGIVADLLTLARHDEGRMPDLVPVDLIDVIYEEVASLLARGSVPVDTSSVLPAVVRGDAYMLAQALRNLLDNAARYARSAICVTCAEEDGTVRLVISDDGPGIPEADRDRVFERFVRLEDGTEAAPASTGLGLAVVKSVVEAHGGTVRFEEAPAGGAAAVIELPAA